VHDFISKDNDVQIEAGLKEALRKAHEGSS
jgi:hypothetical protein